MTTSQAQELVSKIERLEKKRDALRQLEGLFSESSYGRVEIALTTFDHNRDNRAVTGHATITATGEDGDGFVKRMAGIVLRPLISTQADYYDVLIKSAKAKLQRWLNDEA